jgi:hypothetical protein
LESLTADEYEDDIFEMKQLPQAEAVKVESADPLRPLQDKGVTGEIERTLSLADAFIVRNDVEKALATLKAGEAQFGPHPEIVKRMRLVNQRTLERDEAPVEPPPSRKVQALDDKVQFLRSLLERVQRNSGLQNP